MCHNHSEIIYNFLKHEFQNTPESIIIRLTCEVQKGSTPQATSLKQHVPPPVSGEGIIEP